MFDSCSEDNAKLAAKAADEGRASTAARLLFDCMRYGTPSSISNFGGTAMENDNAKKGINIELEIDFSSMQTKPKLHLRHSQNQNGG